MVSFSLNIGSLSIGSFGRGTLAAVPARDTFGADAARERFHERSTLLEDRLEATQSRTDTDAADRALFSDDDFGGFAGPAPAGAPGPAPAGAAGPAPAGAAGAAPAGAAGLSLESFSPTLLLGTPEADLIVGTLGPDWILGFAGDDTLSGEGGGDRIDGGEDDDLLVGGDGADDLWGRGGDDVLLGGAGGDSLTGGEGGDQLTGGIGRDVLSGGDGADILDGGLEGDALFGGDGDDTFVLRAGDGPDLIADFETGADLIGLADGLTFDDLTVTDVAGGALIGFLAEDLALVLGVQVLTEDDFTLI